MSVVDENSTENPEEIEENWVEVKRKNKDEDVQRKRGRREEPQNGARSSSKGGWSQKLARWRWRWMGAERQGEWTS